MSTYFDRTEIIENGCRIVLHCKTRQPLVLASNGYCLVSIAGRHALAHRYAWELVNGPVPDGLVLDHLCRNHACCNPDHLEAITQRENLLRGETFQADNVSKTMCPQGHYYSGSNLRTSPAGKRICRHCHRDHQRKYLTHIRGVA